MNFAVENLFSEAGCRLQGTEPAPPEAGLQVASYRFQVAPMFRSGSSLSFDRFRVSGFCSSEKVFRSSEKVYCSNEKVFYSGEKAFRSSEKVFYNSEKVFCRSEKVFCKSEKVYCSNKKIFCGSENVFCSSEFENRSWFEQPRF